MPFKFLFLYFGCRHLKLACFMSCLVKSNNLMSNAEWLKENIDEYV